MHSVPLILALLGVLQSPVRCEEPAQDMMQKVKALAKADHHDEAAALARTAAEKGSGEAWYWLGMNSTGDTQAYFVKAAEAGYPKAFPYALDAVLFRAGARSDVVEAKKLADLAREKGVKLGYDSKALLRTVDRCFEAGAPVLPAGGAADAGWNALAETYANGAGVPRDARNAIALVCHASSVPAELTGLVDALYQSKDEPLLKEPFRFCDYVTSGENGGVCAAQEESRRERGREQGWTKLAASWTPEQKAALDALRRTGEAFFAEHARSELDMSGSARAAIAIAEEARLRDRLLTDLRIFERGRFPAVREVKATDLELIAVYSRLMKRRKIQRAGTVTRDGVQAAEGKWTAYRDAWLALGAARYPNVPADVWKSWATSRRVKQLRKLSPESADDAE